jgi:GNAT superfamily N-acetyltransferase
MTTPKTKYKSVLATQTHFPVKKLAQFKKKYFQPTMGFFLRGVDIGYGDLMLCEYRKNRTYLQTERVRIREPFRRKGHGIHLYHHLIETARKLGAKRIYSSTILNKHSRKMWSVKLTKVYDVKPVYTHKACVYCSVKSHQAIGYYIVLA